MANWWRSATRGLSTAFPQSQPSISLSPTMSRAALYHTIQAIPREYTGTKVSVRDRAQGRIPAVVCSQSLLEEDASARSVSRKYLLTTEREQIQSIFESVQLPFFCSTLFELQIRAGSGSSVLLESGKVLPIKIHMGEETGNILNLAFVWADEGSELKVDVPVIFKGVDGCPGLQKGGQLDRIRTSLKFLCPAEHIPPKIEVNVSNLDIGDGILLRDIEVHPSLKLLSENENMPICKIDGKVLENPESAGLQTPK